MLAQCLNEYYSYGVAVARRSNKTKCYSSQSAFSLITPGPPCWPGREAKWVLSFFSMRRQAELIVTEQTRHEATPEKFQSTHNTSHSLIIQLWKHPLCARHVPIHFKCSIYKSSSHQIWRGLPSWRTLAKIREDTPHCQMPSQQHG